LREFNDLCVNEMTELDCDNSQDDSRFDELADCDKSHENVLYNDVENAMIVQQQILLLWVLYHFTLMQRVALVSFQYRIV